MNRPDISTKGQILVMHAAIYVERKKVCLCVYGKLVGIGTAHQLEDAIVLPLHMWREITIKKLFWENSIKMA